MFRVDADTLDTYLDFDPIRKIDLQKLDRLLRKSAPRLKRYFHEDTPAGEPGMRFQMIGYGKSHYLAKGGQQVEWPVVAWHCKRATSAFTFRSPKMAPLWCSRTRADWANVESAETISVS
jgi:hypothetical protein